MGVVHSIAEAGMNNGEQDPTRSKTTAKFTIYGEEMLQKEVTWSGKSGRVYVPLGWLGKNVKIIRLD